MTTETDKPSAYEQFCDAVGMQRDTEIEWRFIDRCMSHKGFNRLNELTLLDCWDAFVGQQRTDR